MGYMLITVCEREIMTDQFATFEEARELMMSELFDEIMRAEIAGNAENWMPPELYAKLPKGWGPEELYGLLANYEGTFSSQGYDSELFGFSRFDAWSNLNSYFNYDWQIVGI